MHATGVPSRGAQPGHELWSEGPNPTLSVSRGTDSHQAQLSPRCH